VSLTGVRSRYVATFAGGVLIVLGLVPKLGGVVEGVPLPVLGGAGIALFGMVAASGVRTLAKVRFNNTHVLVVAVAIGVGLLPTVAPTLYDEFPTSFHHLRRRHLLRCAGRDRAQPAARHRGHATARLARSRHLSSRLRTRAHHSG
jgi:xanthine/uracil permease